jgi:hypothetical protein
MKKQTTYYTEHLYHFQCAGQALKFMEYIYENWNLPSLYACKLEQDMCYNSSMLFADVILTAVSDTSKEKMADVFMLWSKSLGSKDAPAHYLGTKRGKKKQIQ